MSALTFKSQAEVEAAIIEIDNRMSMPIIGRNQLTGKLAPKKQQTITWSLPLKVSKESKWWMKNPGGSYTVNVLGKTEEPFDKSWIDAVE